MCTVLLPPGGYPTAVNKYIMSYIISYFIYEAVQLEKGNAWFEPVLNPLKPNDPYSGHTVPLTSKHRILYIYSTNIGTEYFKHGIYSPIFHLQNAVCFVNPWFLYYSRFIYRLC